ncbi:apolipoprotein D-like [Arctopsyche grandis]|uniref:apolipoprotein D-like n=1 Tax=Arctopsyche grandis TaxID=121162 RepID=UPI00406D9BB8
MLTDSVIQMQDRSVYTGLWYEIYRYEQIQQVGGDCVTATYTLEDGIVKVLNRMVLLGTAIQISGTAEVDPEADGGGKLIVKFPTFNATSPYWVLSTDYDDYSLVYVCLNLTSTRKSVSSWILSRKPTLSPQAVLAMNEKIESTDGLVWNTYRQTNQSESACRLREPSTTTSATTLIL